MADDDFINSVLGEAFSKAPEEELPSVVASEEEVAKHISGKGLWQTGKDWLGTVLSDAFDDVGEAYGTAVQSIGPFASQTIENAKSFSGTGAFALPLGASQVVAEGLVSAIEENPWQTAEKAARTVAQTAVAATTGPLFPVAWAATGYLADRVADAATGIRGYLSGQNPQKLLEDFFTEATSSRKFRKELVEVATPLVVGKLTNKAIRQTTRAVRGPGGLNLPKGEVHEITTAKRPDALIIALRPEGNSRASVAFGKDLEDALPTFLNEENVIWKGVDRTKFDPKVAPLDYAAAKREYDKLQNNIVARVSNLSDSKMTALQELDLQGAKNGLVRKNVAVEDLSLDDIQDLIERRDISAITKDSAQELRNIVDTVQGDFFSVIFNPKTGKGFNSPKSLIESEMMLRNIYNRLEQAKAFDAYIAAGKIQNAAQAQAIMVANDELVIGLRSAAHELKKKMSSAADTIISRNPALRARGYRPGMVQIINDKIHNLIPVRDAIKAYTIKTQSTLGPRPGMNIGEPAGPLGEVNRAVGRAVFDSEQRRIGAGLATEPALGRRLDLISQYQQPGANPPGYFTGIPGLEDPALMGGVGAGATFADELASSMELQKQAAELEKKVQLQAAESKYGLDFSTFGSVDFEDGDVYLEDKNDQEDYINYLRSSGAPTHFIASQHSQFNNAVAPSILLEPPKKKPKIEEAPDIRLHRSESEKAAEYAY